MGSAREVPSRAIGRIGARVRSASSNAPLLNGRMRPSTERVPSGKIITELPPRSVASHISIIRITLSRLPRTSGMYRLSDMFQPISGIRKFSIFETHLKCRNSRNSTRMSTKDWWFETIT